MTISLDANEIWLLFLAGCLAGAGVTLLVLRIGDFVFLVRFLIRRARRRTWPDSRPLWRH